MHDFPFINPIWLLPVTFWSLYKWLPGLFATSPSWGLRWGWFACSSLALPLKIEVVFSFFWSSSTYLDCHSLPQITVSGLSVTALSTCAGIPIDLRELGIFCQFKWSLIPSSSTDSKQSFLQTFRWVSRPGIHEEMIERHSLLHVLCLQETAPFSWVFFLPLYLWIQGRQITTQQPGADSSHVPT